MSIEIQAEIIASIEEEAKRRAGELESARSEAGEEPGL
jgi:hypothetical protein